MKSISRLLFSLFAFAMTSVTAFASEINLPVPGMEAGAFPWMLGINGFWILFLGLLLSFVTLGISIYLFKEVKKLEVHKRMAAVADIIYATCGAYLMKQIKFLLALFCIIGIAFAVYIMAASSGGNHGESLSFTAQMILLAQVLFFALVGMAGSAIVAWYGIRLNTYANARTAFASLKAKPWDVVNIPLQAGMSVGLFLISLELVVMIIILLMASFDIIPVGICFLGFAIGESLGASALRIAGGIFTKIADIGSDLMKIVFKVGEDDPRNPGVIADCTGDNAGDSVGPTADGFETYGVTGVALITFIVLAVPEQALQAQLITWIFFMRVLMGCLSGAAYFINQKFAMKDYANKKEAGAEDFEKTLTNLIWISAGLCIAVAFIFSGWMLGPLGGTVWAQLAGIITCGTLAAVLIPEFTKIFTSSSSKHVQEVVTASREGGASLNILSGITAGNFSAFWTGGLIAVLMAAAYTLTGGLETIFGAHAPIFAFGLVAFGFLGMGPVTIAVDSYGPVTDNAQSIFELSQIEAQPGIKEEINKEFGFTPDFEMGKHYLEANDGAGNTFKATAKPVLIGTAVAGATTMIFAIILILEKLHALNPELGILGLDLTQAPVILGLICGGAVIYWFSGAATQAVTTGAYEAVEFIKRTFDMNKTEADINDAKKVVEICTQYAQTGMWNIFLALFCLTLAFAFVDPNFFVAYLVSIAIFGLFQAIYMANAGGSWDNAKKVVEVDLKEKGSALHDASVIGDTVGDPFKDTSSVSLNPIIKFSTLFGLLATEIAIAMKYVEVPKLGEDGKAVVDEAGKAMMTVNVGTFANYTPVISVVFLAIGLYFVWRSFYKTRIPVKG
jgi:K(+)-stimulated pyrophosphate-energized sodium pump